VSPGAFRKLQDQNDPTRGDATPPADDSVETEFPAPVGYSNVKGSRRITAQSPDSDNGSFSLGADAPEHERPSRNATATVPASVKADNTVPTPPSKPGADNQPARKEIESSSGPAHDAKGNATNQKSPPTSVVSGAALQSALTGFAAQTNAAPAQAQVLSKQPDSRHYDRSMANIAPAASRDVVGTPEVKIGRVDVFVEDPGRSKVREPGAARPSPSLASRHYLRRL
jgi:hypothetical protein